MSDGPEWWELVTAFSVAATALLTGVWVLSTWVIHRRDRAKAGVRNPIRYLGSTVLRDVQLPSVVKNPDEARAVALKFFNQSDVPQRLRTWEHRTWIIWPRVKHRALPRDLVELAPRTSVSVVVIFVLTPKGRWRRRLSAAALREEDARCVIRYRGWLESGEKVSFLRRATAYASAAARG